MAILGQKPVFSNKTIIQFDITIILRFGRAAHYPEHREVVGFKWASLNNPLDCHILNQLSVKMRHRARSTLVF